MSEPCCEFVENPVVAPGTCVVLNLLNPRNKLRVIAFAGPVGTIPEGVVVDFSEIHVHPETWAEINAPELHVPVADRSKLS